MGLDRLSRRLVDCRRLPLPPVLSSSDPPLALAPPRCLASEEEALELWLPPPLSVLVLAVAVLAVETVEPCTAAPACGFWPSRSGCCVCWLAVPAAAGPA